MNQRPTGYLIKQIHDSLEKRANNDLRSMNLTMSQLEVLLLLNEVTDKSLALKDLESDLRVSQPTVVGLVKRLEQKDFVESFGDSRDRRIKVIRLTSQGQRCSIAAKHNIDSVENLLLAGLNQEEQSEFQRILVHILRNLQK